MIKPSTPEYPPLNLSVKQWAEADRPREKLLLRGKHALTDAELLAILLGSGSREETVVSLAKRILGGSSNNLHELGKRTVAELLRFKGIGQAKALTLVAALELGRRRQLARVGSRPQIRSSRDANRVIGR